MAVSGTPTIDLFIHGCKQIYQIFFEMFFCLIICWGFFNVFENFQPNFSLKKESIRVVSIIFEQALHVLFHEIYFNFLCNVCLLAF